MDSVRYAIGDDNFSSKWFIQSLNDILGRVAEEHGGTCSEASTGSGPSGAIDGSPTNFTTIEFNATYDYITVCAGAAGLVVAERLAHQEYDVPGMAYHLTTANDTSGYCSGTAGMTDCILGGGTTIHALIKWFSGNGFTLVDAIEESGKKKAVFTHPHWMINNSLRAGPVRDYYLPLAQQLPNFKLQLNTKVLRVIRDGETATGIEVQCGPATRQMIKVKANGAVILALVLSPPQDFSSTPASALLSRSKAYPMAASASRFLPRTNGSISLLINMELYPQGSGLLAQSGQRFMFWDAVKGSDGVERYFQGTCTSAGDDVVKLKVFLTRGATPKGSLKVDSTGTAHMGAENDGSSVVDTDANVRGTHNLFVVNASIHPDPPTGKSQTIVVIAAEHAVTKTIGNGNGVVSTVTPTNGTAATPVAAPVDTPTSKTRRSFRQRRLY
ncbi:hypothetical protein F66182_2604 [Fusarium sp. NRRL 66182]|nr:hypothetical protein F66182_2604 [Fusarium sp. NRRL 66182]